MRRVIALELIGLKKLDCDLYNENGGVIYEKNTEFTPELLMKLSHSKIFKRDEQEYLEEQTVQVIEKPKEPTPPEPQNIPEKAEYKTILNTEKIEKLIDNVKDILKAINEGVAPKSSVCMDATQSILDEVYEKCDKVSNIGQLRIHDYYTYTHSINTAILSAIIGREIGLHENKVKDLTLAGLLHDVGKIKIPSNVLYKPGKLTPEEFILITNHALLGYNFIINEMELPDYIAKGAMEHHERWTGDGYPYRLKGKEISEFGQIIAIADVFDALVSEKVYRNSIPSNDAIRTMLTEESKSFNPEIFHKFAFLAVVKTVKICP